MSNMATIPLLQLSGSSLSSKSNIILLTYVKIEIIKNKISFISVFWLCSDLIKLSDCLATSMHTYVLWIYVHKLYSSNFIKNFHNFLELEIYQRSEKYSVLMLFEVQLSDGLDIHTSFLGSFRESPFIY